MTIEDMMKKGHFPIEIAPIIRCKDCKYCIMMGGSWGECHNPRFGDGWGNYPPPSVDEDGYCSWGEIE